MATDVVICNLALARLGNAADVSSISPPDNSVEANYCATFYPVALAAILDKHNWNFATRRAMLATVTNNTSEWDYCYAVPADFINLVSLKADSVTELFEYSTEMATIASVDTYVLYCNATPVELKYCSSTVLPSKFPPLFVEALSLLVAYYLAGPMLKGDVGVSAQKSLLQLFMTALGEAIESDTQNYKRNLSSVGYRPAGISARG